MVPYQRNVHFTGREKLLATVHNELSKELPQRWNHRLALYGLGGVGKTQLALEYAYSHKENYHGVYWLSAVSQATLFSGFTEIAVQTSCIAKTATLNCCACVEVAKPRREVAVDCRQFGGRVGGRCGDTLITTRNQHYDQIPAKGLEIGVLDTEAAISPRTSCGNTEEDLRRTAPEYHRQFEGS